MSGIINEPMNKNVIQLNHLHKSFLQGKTLISVLNNINTIFVQGKTYAITGHPGSGKSTLIHIIAGIDSPTSGSVVFQNSVVHNLSTQQLSLHAFE